MKGCVFCKIVSEDFPKGLITEWEDAIALHPLNPVTEGHVLIIPRVHVEDFATDWHVTSVTAGRASEFVSSLREPMDFNLITSKGANATQTVFHLHLHLVPRRPGDGLTLPWTGQKEQQRGGIVVNLDHGPDTRDADNFAIGYGVGLRAVRRGR